MTSTNPSTPAPSGRVVAALVDDNGYVIAEPVLGTTRYPDGSLVVITQRTPPWASHTTTVCAYKLTRSIGLWQTVMRKPDEWVTLTTTQPVGTTGKVAGRKLEIVDFATVVPLGTIILTTNGMAAWVTPTP